VTTHTFAEDSGKLVNFATGVVLPSSIAEKLLASTDKGRKQMKAFVEKRLNSDETSIWDPVTSLKIKIFSTTKRRQG